MMKTYSDQFLKVKTKEQVDFQMKFANHKNYVTKSINNTFKKIKAIRAENFMKDHV